jgi:hypothetical protein
VGFRGFFTGRVLPQETGHDDSPLARKRETKPVGSRLEACWPWLTSVAHETACLSQRKLLTISETSVTVSPSQYHEVNLLF